MKPLAGLRILEFAGLAPAPFAAMMLADHGAEVVRIERAGWAPPIPPDKDILRRGRAEILTLDLKAEADAARARDLACSADGLIEGFRPGVMERLGLGPDLLCRDNPRLVYGRMTGWGQEGPLAGAAGHDINYIALAGNLHGYGRADGKPTPPLNAVGDFGGGGMLLAFAMLAGILSARATGKGSVIDCAMVDGAALLAAQTWSLLAAGMWKDERGANLLDGGAAFYDSYECADGKFIAVGALEPQFFAALAGKLNLSVPQNDPGLRDRLSELFRTRPRDQWCALLEGSDACVAPVLSMAEAPAHPHNAARGTFIEADGLVQPAPAPRFSQRVEDDPAG
ncbi:CaiB/BaiF CoA transferase family protein [Sphingosinicella humi]|uniref:CaiB/BaiF CoA transferase family protein n=1 Tax=Allosphingosinicella humi TaxID=2068657 RepID=UPI001FB0B7A4|nr:CaiB/BaiF CoA-transferase family protein [Sphingosinicella humi]